jgi:hypothetical protein
MYQTNQSLYWFKELSGFSPSLHAPVHSGHAPVHIFQTCFAPVQLQLALVHQTWILSDFKLIFTVM